MRKLEPMPLKVKVERQQLNTVNRYLIECAMRGFEGVNNYRKIQPVREEFFIYHLKCLLDKLSDLIYKKGSDPRVKIVSLKISHAEQITLSNMFKRVEVPPDLRGFELSIINHLTLLHNDNTSRTRLYF